MGRLAEIQRKVLEQMMGPEAMGYTPVNVDWWSDKVCRNFLFGTCPHLIFTNTKMDLGPCPKTHSDRVLTQFRAAREANPNDPRFAQYEQEHENAIYSFVEECDRKIRMSQRRLEKTPEENKKTVDLMREVGEIELAIQGGTEEIEQLGEAGKVEESMAKLAAVDALKTLKQEKERDLQQLTETAGASGHQKLRVCETCGAYLSILDSDRRLADHFGGKMHLGYHELRKLIESFQEKRMAARNAPPPMQQQYKPPVPPFNAPSGPNGGAPQPPQTPHTPLDAPKLPPANELPGAGHGVKAEREAGELVDDLSSSRKDKDRYESRSSRHDSRDHERSDRDRSDRDRSDRDRSDRDKRSDRDRSDRDRSDRDKDRDGERHRSSRSSRSKSPSRRR